jgi:hypothetical protein
LALKKFQKKKFTIFDTNKDGIYGRIQSFEISIKTMRIIFFESDLCPRPDQIEYLERFIAKKFVTGA